MTRKLIALALVLSACSAESGDGSGGCQHASVGVWHGVNYADRIELASNGTFDYAGPDGCVSTGTFACPPAGASSGTMRVEILSSTGGACLPAGSYTCAFAVNGGAMGYDCTGNGMVQYRR